MLRHQRDGPAAIRQGRRHRLGVRRRGQPGGVWIDGNAHAARQDHDRHRGRLHDHVVHAGDPGRRARELGRARTGPGARRRAGARRIRPRRIRPHRAGGAGVTHAGPAALIVMRRADLPRLLAPLLLLVAAGCGGEADSAVDPGTGQLAGKPAYGDTYIEALQGNISGLIPNVLSDGPSFEVGSLIYNGLVKYDKDLNLVGELAESWQYSRDCLDLTFKLRPNVRWHDNQPFTAADVIFTYETMINPKTPTAYGGDFKAVESVVAPDPYTVHVRYKHPSAKALQSWSIWMLPKHLLESYAREGKLREAPQNRANPVGTGPYRFSEWKPGEKVVLVANSDYFEGRPYISRVVYRIIPSSATTFLELKAKGVDGAKLTALQFKRQTEYPAFRKAYTKYQYA